MPATPISGRLRIIIPERWRYANRSVLKGSNSCWACPASITPPGGESPDDDLLIVHATPREIGELLFVERHPLYRNPLTPVADARRLMDGARANLIVGGHVHFRQWGLIDGQRFATIAPVSFSIDGDPRAGYALATWDGGDWNLDHRRVAYDVEAVADEIARSELARASEWAEQLRTAIMKELFSRYST